MYAIRNKKNGKLLQVNAEVQQYGDYGGWEITYQTYHRANIDLRTSNYPGVVFTTDSKYLVDELLKTGKSESPYISIELDGWEKHKLIDFQIVDFEVPGEPPVSASVEDTLDRLSCEEREKLFLKYCRCGDKDPSCQCWNDE